MPRFNLSAIITVSAFCEVEADSLEDAIEKSRSLPPAYHSIGTGTDPEENWCVEEIDGEPVEITGEQCQANIRISSPPDDIAGRYPVNLRKRSGGSDWKRGGWEDVTDAFAFWKVKRFGCAVLTERTGSLVV